MNENIRRNIPFLALPLALALSACDDEEPMGPDAIIIDPNISARNGIIHVIDRVIFPG